VAADEIAAALAALEARGEACRLRLGGKIFLDYNRNRRAASPAAAVSTPLDRDELDSVYPTRFDILNMPERLAQRGDVRQPIFDTPTDLDTLLAG
jgi:DNA primase